MKNEEDMTLVNNEKLEEYGNKIVEVTKEYTDVICAQDISITLFHFAIRYGIKNCASKEDANVFIKYISQRMLELQQNEK